MATAKCFHGGSFIFMVWGVVSVPIGQCEGHFAEQEIGRGCVYSSEWLVEKKKGNSIIYVFIFDCLSSPDRMPL